MHACLICWTGREDAARTIAAALLPHVDRLTVVYSNRAERDEAGPGDWIKVPDAWFYGRKFRRALDAHDGGPMLLVQADAHCDDWGALVEGCRRAFRDHPDLGVWAPDIHYTPFSHRITRIDDLPGTTLSRVTQTDGIVWALSERVADRLRVMHFEENNLGWGIDWAAIAYAYASGLLVLRDTALRVGHPKGSGYAIREAKPQMQAFLAQLTLRERLQLALLRARIGLARAARRLDRPRAADAAR